MSAFSGQTGPPNALKRPTLFTLVFTPSKVTGMDGFGLS
jgi:hypothetical protein